MKRQNEKIMEGSRVNPGDIVPGGFSYANNATVSGDFLYLRDANGNKISGRSVSDGDRITVLKVIDDTNLALVQYPAGSDVRQGYVTNATNIIKYDHLDGWINGSTNEPVFETEVSTNGSYGTLFPREKATFLFKKGSRYNVVYETSKGPRTKSGYVNYHGGIGSGGGNGVDPWPNIVPGGMVPGGFTFPNNARISGGNLQLKDANGNNVSGTVTNGDKITVLDVGHSKQLTLIQYPASGGVKQGYVANDTNLIRYNNEYDWYNGKSQEPVYSKYNTNDSEFGVLSPRESATKLYEYGGRVHIAYDTAKGMLTKSGYVNYKGRIVPARQQLDLGSIGHKNARLEVYGKSGNNYDLNAYKLGAIDNGAKMKKIFLGFGIHGWEDHWRFDGEAIVKIGDRVLDKLGDYISTHGNLNGWQVCIAPCMNPDGLITGRTSYGPGRCAVTTKIDLNRCFPTGFSAQYAPRYYTGPNPLGAPEAVALKNLVTKLSNESSELMVVDCHGWLGFTQGNYDVGKYFTEQFGFTHKTQYSGGFFSTWANSLSNTKGVLLEYPKTTDDFSIVESYAEKTFRAIIKIINSSNGNGGTNPDTGNEEEFYKNGEVNAGVTAVNIRKGPSTNTEILGTLAGGAKLDISRRVKPAGDSYYWYRIVFKGQYAYIRQDFVKILGDSSGGEIVVGSKVKVIGTHWETGQLIPDWVKNEEYIVERIDRDKDRALLAKITSWAYLKDLVLVDGGGNPDTGTGEVSYVATGRVNAGVTAVNIRKGSSISTEILGTLAGGAPLSISKKIKPEGDTYTWYKIEFQKQLGYIREDFITIEYNYKKQERVVIVGAEGAARYPNFLESAVKKLKDFKAQYPNDKRTLYVATLGLTVTERSLIVDLQAEYDYECIFYTDRNILYKYLNSSKFKIAEMFFYAHGKPGAILLGYGAGGDDNIISNPHFDIYKNQIKDINFNIFSNESITEFYSCYTGLPENDFSKVWYDLNLSQTKAAYLKTDYTKIIGITPQEINEHIAYREQGLAFNPTGARYYPKLSTVVEGNNWQCYPPKVCE